MLINQKRKIITIPPIYLIPGMDDEEGVVLRSLLATQISLEAKGLAGSTIIILFLPMEASSGEGLVPVRRVLGTL